MLNAPRARSRGNIRHSVLFSVAAKPDPTLRNAGMGGVSLNRRDHPRLFQRGVQPGAPTGMAKRTPTAPAGTAGMREMRPDRCRPSVLPGDQFHAGTGNNTGSHHATEGFDQYVERAA